MCGGCPGGAAISPLSAHVNLRGIKAQVTSELSARCSPRFRIAVFGDSWVVTGATGKQAVYASIEDVALAIVSAARVTDAPASSQHTRKFPDPSILSPTELVDCLLWFAANEPSVLRSH